MVSTSQEQLKNKIRLKLIKSASYLTVLIVYLAIGAVIFRLAEYDNRQHKIQQSVEELDENRSDLLKVLWGATIVKNEDDWTLIANERLDMYENQLAKHVVVNGVDKDEALENQNPWNYLGSFFYCFVTVSTIGYGNMVPETDFGKIFTILYSIIGIPLTLIVLSEMGKCLTLALKYVSAKSRGEDDATEEFNFGPLLALTLTFIFIFTGAAVFSLLEDWDMLDSFYFTWITFSTIGFGDFVPEHSGYMIFAMVYVFTALTLCSMCFYSVQQWAEVYVDAIQSCTRCFLAKKLGLKIAPDEKRAKDHVTNSSNDRDQSRDTIIVHTYESVAESALRHRAMPPMKKLTENSEEAEVEEEED